MPRFGETFINAIGREVVASGGATPSSTAVPVTQQQEKNLSSGVIAQDIYGREYDTAVPVFLYTGTRFVVDRLAAAGPPRKGWGNLIDLESLNRKATEIGYVWPPEERGYPPQWWLDANPGYPIYPPGQPVITGQPTVSGDPTVGETLTAAPATATGNPTPTRTWKWQRDDGGWADIAGATAATYVVAIADAGYQLRVVQIETNSEGSATANSAAVGPAVHANRVLFGGDELQFNGMTVVHSGGDGINTLTIAAGTGMSVTQTETLVTLDAT